MLACIPPFSGGGCFVAMCSCDLLGGRMPFIIVVPPEHRRHVHGLCTYFVALP